MNRLKLYTAVIYIVGSLMSQNTEYAEAAPQGQADTDDGGPDDAERILTYIEKKPLLMIEREGDSKLEPIRVPRGWTKDTIAPEWLINRMSELQAAVVKLRKSYEKTMREHAAWSCRWMEVHFPEYFACVTKNYVDLVVDDCKEYPKGLLFTIKNLKELYIKSFVKKIPVYKLNQEIWRRTEYHVNGLLPAIKQHRRMLEELAVDKLKSQASSVKVICRLPAADRHPVEKTQEVDPTYVFEEDYSPVAYNRL